MQVVRSTTKGKKDEEEEEEEETEFVQELHPAMESDSGTASTIRNYYGFNDEFEGFFRNMDEDYVTSVVDLPSPDSMSECERKKLRVAEEQTHFDEDSVLDDMFGDGKAHVEEVLYQFKPWYVVAFEEGLKCDGVRYVCAAQQNRSHSFATKTSNSVQEEEETPIASVGGVVQIWEGNIGTFDAKSLESDELSSHPETTLLGKDQLAGSAPLCVRVSASAVPSLFLSTKLACPATKPRIGFTLEESAAMGTLNRSCHLVTREQRIHALLVDILAAYVYDLLTTEGEGCSESIWTLTKLSSSLCWLDIFDSLYDVCIAFLRRVLVYPLHRSYLLGTRCLRDVGIVLLSGRFTVIRCLLYVKDVLDHSETKHVLANLFVNPLITYLQGGAEIDHILEQIAMELHSIMAGGGRSKRQTGMEAVAELARVSHSISIADLNLPFTLVDES